MIALLDLCWGGCELREDQHELIKAIEQWLAEAKVKIDQLKNRALRIDRLESWQLSKDGSLEKLTRRASYSPDLKASVFDESSAWQTVKALALSDEAIAAVATERLWWSNLSFGQRPLEELFECLLPVPTFLDDQIFYRDHPASSVREFLHFLRETHFPSTTIWPLSGLETETPLELGEGLQFRALTAQERLQILKVGIIHIGMNTRVTPDCARWYGLCLTKQYARYVREDEPDTTNPRVSWEEQYLIIEDFMAAASFALGHGVQHSGGLYIPPAVQIEGFGTFIDTKWPEAFSLDPLRWQFTYPADISLITEHKKLELLSAWNVLRGYQPQTLSKSGRERSRKKLESAIANVIRRLYYARTRIRPEDQLLDVIIAAETLYGGDGRSEKTYRLAVSAALLADASSNERAGIYKEFKDAYDLRSEIVHGGTVSHAEAQNVVSRVSDRVRAYSKKLLSDHKLARDWPDWHKLLFRLSDTDDQIG